MANERNVLLRLVKGDTLTFSMTFTGLSGDLASASFRAKTSYNNDTYAFNKTIGSGITKTSAGKYSVRLAPSDTSGLNAGTYHYDVKVGVGTEMYTIMWGDFILLPST